jgi:hypothetical protein
MDFGRWLSAEETTELLIDALEGAILIQKEKNFNIAPKTRKLIVRITVLQKRVILLMSDSAIE